MLLLLLDAPFLRYPLTLEAITISRVKYLVGPSGTPVLGGENWARLPKRGY